MSNFTFNNLVYQIIPNTTNCKVIYDSGYSGDINIPSEAINNSTGISYYVTEINAKAFSRLDGLISVIIGNNVTTIGWEAFEYCDYLTSVTIGLNVTTIVSDAFYECTRLNEVIMGDNVTSIGHDAFVRCYALTTIVIPNKVTTIEYNTFSLCTGLSSVTIGNKVTSIGASAFQGCKALININIPNSITSIGYNAFNDCTITLNLKYTTIPQIITYNTFPYISQVASSTYPYTALTYNSSTTNRPPNSSISTPLSNLGAVSVAVGSTALFNYTVSSNNSTDTATITGINSSDPSYSNIISIPSIISDNATSYSVTTIGNGAFFNSSIISVTIPNNVITIGNSAFAYNKLTNVNIPNTVTTIGNNAFQNNELSSVTIPNTITTISDYAFQANRLTNLSIPNTVTTIGNNAFQNNSFSNLIIPNTVTTIRDNAFSGSDTLTSVEVPNTVTSFGKGVFSALTNLLTANMYNTNINDSTFVNCINLKTIIMPNVTSIGDNAFQNCTNLTNITLPNTLLSIGNSAFGSCINLPSILTIPPKVVSIDADAFGGCNSLKTVTIPKSVVTIATNVFSYCQNIETVNIDTTTINRVFSDKFSIKTVVIGSNVQTIDVQAFGGCGNLSNVTIGNNVKTINTFAFGVCLSLSSITIPTSVTKIDPNAFIMCTSLKLYLTFTISPQTIIFNPDVSITQKQTSVAEPNNSQITINDTVLSIPSVNNYIYNTPFNYTINNNKFNFVTGTPNPLNDPPPPSSGSASGDPYVITMETGETYKIPSKIKNYRLFESQNIIINASVAPIKEQYENKIIELFKDNTFFRPKTDGFYFDKFYININNSYFIFDEAINLLETNLETNNEEIIVIKDKTLYQDKVNGISSRYYITVINYFDCIHGNVKIILKQDLNPQIINGIECQITNTNTINITKGALVRRSNPRNYEIKNLDSLKPIKIKYETSDNYHLAKENFFEIKL